MLDNKQEMFDPTAELDDLLKLPKEIEGVDGTKIAIPTPSWRAEAQIVRSIGKILKRVQEETSISWEEISTIQKEKNLSQVIKLLTVACETAPEEITKIISAILHQSEDFVESKLDSTLIMGILIPFFSSRVEKLKPLIGPMIAGLDNVTPNSSTNLGPTPSKTKNPH